ncbi:hypothetical protein ACQP25_30515 [Microtetraspora malaysiensis]|uniref:hypothetical protein n=1 Tax=Microtetraspora malaysiensis TaxID=161358 RepID=UPI003D936C00
MDVEAMTALLRDIEEHHGPYEARAPKHHWSHWYAAYMVARQAGRTPKEEERQAADHTEGNFDVQPL